MKPSGHQSQLSDRTPQRPPPPPRRASIICLAVMGRRDVGPSSIGGDAQFGRTPPPAPPLAEDAAHFPIRRPAAKGHSTRRRLPARVQSFVASPNQTKPRPIAQSIFPFNGLEQSREKSWTKTQWNQVKPNQIRSNPKKSNDTYQSPVERNIEQHWDISAY